MLINEAPDQFDNFEMCISNMIQYLYRVKGILKVCPNLLVFSGQWWYCGFGQPRRDPKTSVSVPKRRPHSPVPHVSGNGPASSWPVRSSSVVPKRKGTPKTHSSAV